MPVGPIHRPTHGQLRVLVFVAAYADAVGEAPTRSEIAEYVGTRHRQQIHAQLRQLEQRGLLVRATMQVTDEGRRALGLLPTTKKARRDRRAQRLRAAQELQGLDVFKDAFREWLGLGPLPSEGNARGWSKRLTQASRTGATPPSGAGACP